MTTGKCTFFQNISYTNVNSRYIFWNNMPRNIFYDMDGTLSGSKFNGGTARYNSTILPYYVHNDGISGCSNNTNSSLWDTSMICDNTTQVRTIMITNALPFQNFQNQLIKFYRLQTPTDNISNITSGYSQQWVVMTDNMDKPQDWAAPFVLDNFYDVWWNQGIDFDSVSVMPSVYFTPTDKAVIFRFNYTLNRELYENALIVGQVLQLPYITEQASMLNTSICNVGDYYQDSTNHYIYVCISGRQKPITTYVNLNGIFCLYLCPQAPGEFTKEPFVRLWSNATQWPNGVMPVSGDNVTVNGNWTVLMDVDPAPILYLIIDGDVIVNQRNTSISAYMIWIRAGSLAAGNASVPFNYSLTITLLGNESDAGYSISPLAQGSKFIVVTGNLSLFGNVPSTVWTRLTAGAFAGNTTISVASTSGWAVGDQLVIGPSFNNP